MKFEIYKDSQDLFRWRLKAVTGEIVADCAEGYGRRSDCRHGIELVLSVGRRELREVVDDLTD